MKDSWGNGQRMMAVDGRMHFYIQASPIRCIVSVLRKALHIYHTRVLLPRPRLLWRIQGLMSCIIYEGVGITMAEGLSFVTKIFRQAQPD